LGFIPGREAHEVVWDAQSFLEEATCKGIAAVVSSYDFSKYFDSFDHDFTNKNSSSCWDTAGAGSVNAQPLEGHE